MMLIQSTTSLSDLLASLWSSFSISCPSPSEAIGGENFESFWASRLVPEGIESCGITDLFVSHICYLQHPKTRELWARRWPRCFSAIKMWKHHHSNVPNQSRHHPSPLSYRSLTIWSASGLTWSGETVFVRSDHPPIAQIKFWPCFFVKSIAASIDCFYQL